MADKKRRSVKEFEATILSLEKRRKSRIFSIIHNGPPHHICQPSLGKTIALRDKFRNIDTLEILIHSPGGHTDVAYQMAKFFRSHCKVLNAIVPLYAKSAATALCLNVDNIFMGEFAELGPLDVQVEDELERGKRSFPPLNEFKSMEFLKEHATEYLDFFTGLLVERGLSVKQALHEAIPGVVGVMSPLYAHIDPSKLGSYRRMLAEGEEYAKRLLESAHHPDVADLVQQLVWEYPSHDFVIDRDEAMAIGLPIKRLELAQERSLINAVLGLGDDEISFTGFVAREQPKAKANPKARKRRGNNVEAEPQRRKMPAKARLPVPAAGAAGA